MRASQFVSVYIEILEEIDAVISPTLYSIIQQMYCIDPHDLITPETVFQSRDHAYGFVLRIILNEAKARTNATV